MLFVLSKIYHAQKNHVNFYFFLKYNKWKQMSLSLNILQPYTGVIMPYLVKIIVGNTISTLW